LKIPGFLNPRRDKRIDGEEVWIGNRGYTRSMINSLATIVTPSANTEQLLALIALIVFGVAALVALGARTYYAVLMAGGLAVLAAAILWS
jgi:hypothetical protein